MQRRKAYIRRKPSAYTNTLPRLHPVQLLYCDSCFRCNSLKKLVKFLDITNLIEPVPLRSENAQDALRKTYDTDIPFSSFLIDGPVTYEGILHYLPRLIELVLSSFCRGLAVKIRELPQLNTLISPIRTFPKRLS